MIHLRQTGYTLIEIMIAVAILAILSAIAIPIYEGYVTEGRYGAATKDLRQMELLLADLAVDNDLAAVEPTGYGGGSSLNVYTNPNGVVVAASAPTDAEAWIDPWGQTYRYQRIAATQNPQVFELRSAGPDASFGNADDACQRSDGVDCP